MCLVLLQPRPLRGRLLSTPNMRLLPAFAVLVLAVIVCSTLSDAERVVKKSQFHRYMRFARQLALRYRYSGNHAKRVTKIIGVTREGNSATINFEAVNTVCKPGRRYPTKSRCPEISDGLTDNCIGSVEFIGGSFRRVKYGETMCIAIGIDIRPL
ncbi:uncharacterized protein LOC125946649 [Dermacentor silvarum]|uniref:uncharacterized protein LOC125946649 n=1 Tax=Dermacentor silvarum TaxID=543639 RepID=UPI0021008FBB|nr:uncharacterized protein LOC125946649 [Dermacentor silvarum]